MKKIIVTLSLSLPGFFLHAQNGLENIIVEKYYISNAADAAQADVDIDDYNTDNGTSLPHGALPAGSVTYRVYADLLPNYKIMSIYGDAAINPCAPQPLMIATTTSFYNHPLGTSTPVPGTAKTVIKNNLMAIDSYYSLGGVCTGNHGILKAEDNGALNNITVASNPAGVLLNNHADAGIVLTTQDGMIAGSGVISPSTAGFTATNDAVFNDGTILSDTFLLKDGSWFTSAGAAGPDPATNKVLIGQFTTGGVFSFQLNIMIKSTTTGLPEYYVAKNPKADHGDIQLASLTYPLVAFPPTVNIAPFSNPNYLTGEVISISAASGDVDGTVSKVEFFVDGVSLSVNNVPTATVTASYTCTVGTHTLTAVATDNTSLTTTSSAVLINVKNNTPPLASILAPLNNAQFYIGDVVNITVDASDPDSHTGSKVDSVKFYVDGTYIGFDNTGTSPYGPVSYTFTVAGTHTLTAVAKDERGLTTTSAAVLIHVLAGIPPTVSITSPVDASHFDIYAGDYITVSATASDAAPGYVAQVEFFDGSTSLGVDNSAPYSISFPAAAPVGARQLTAVATDDMGLKTTSASILIYIDNLTGVNDLSNSEVFRIYPNPAQNTITLEILGSQNPADHYTIYGIEGNVILRKELGAASVKYTETIDIASFASGQYMIALSVNGITSTKTLIKK